MKQRYKDNYDTDKILAYMKEHKTNITDMRKTLYPHMGYGSIFHWFKWQTDDYKKQIKELSLKNYTPAPQIVMEKQELERKKLIQNQKKWRQRVESLVILKLTKGVQNVNLNK